MQVFPSGIGQRRKQKVFGFVFRLIFLRRLAGFDVATRLGARLAGPMLSTLFLDSIPFLLSLWHLKFLSPSLPPSLPSFSRSKSPLFPRLSFAAPAQPASAKPQLSYFIRVPIACVSLLYSVLVLLQLDICNYVARMAIYVPIRDYTFWWG